MLSSISASQWALIALGAMLIGMNKTGLQGIGMLSVPIFAAVFGGRLSTGIVLPLLSIADVFAVLYYHQHAQWKYVVRLLPWTFCGILTGVAIGNAVSDETFRMLIGVVVLAGLAVLVWRETRKDAAVPTAWWFAALAGIASGVATMIGNAAGPITTVFFLAMLMPKRGFIGTQAWYKFIANLLKVPFHIFIWRTITFETLTVNFILAPAVFVGAFIGYHIVKLIPEKPYRVFVITATFLATIRLFI